MSRLKTTKIKNIKEKEELEEQIAASVLYYDKEEFDKFIKFWRSIDSDDPAFRSTGNFTYFIESLNKIFEESDDSMDRHKKLSFLQERINTEPNKLKRDSFKLWLSKIDAFDNPALFELSDDLFARFLWESKKELIKRIDNEDISFKDKLSIIEEMNVNFEMHNNNVFTDIFDDEDEDNEINYDFSTGLNFLDDYVIPQSSNFVVIGARPSVGKTTLMLHMALENAKNDVKSIFISLEMNKRQLNKKIYNWFAGHAVTERAEKNKIKMDPEFQRIINNINFVINTSNNPDSFFKIAKDECKKGNIKILFIDYLQIAKYPTLDEWESLRKLSLDCKKFATTNQILVVSCSQVSRGSINEGLTLGSLFGSSTIEADTDIVIGIEEKGGVANLGEKQCRLKVLKNRDGVKDVSIDIIIKYDIMSFNEKRS